MENKEKLSIDKLLDEREKLNFKLLELEEKKKQEIEQLKDEIAKLKLELLRAKHLLESKEKEVEEEKKKTKTVIEKVYVPVRDERETKYWELKFEELKEEYENKINEKEKKISELENITRDLNNKLYELKLQVSEFENILQKLKNTINNIIYKNFYTQVELYKRFTSGVLSKLKNYLSTINILTDLATKKVKDKKIKNYVNIAAEQTKKITELFDKINIHLFPPYKLELMPSQVNDIVEAAIKEIDIDPQKIKIKTTLAQQIPKVNVDARWIKKALHNILINAVEAINENKDKTGEIAISTEEKDGNVAICVSDNGCGIDENLHYSLFTPFFTTKKDNIGLGLFISKIILHAHQGNIEIYSTKGKGTTVIIQIPSIRE